MAKLLGSKKMDKCTGCMVTNWVVTLLLFVTSIASALGAYMAHFPTEEGMVVPTFGTTTGSLSILAFAVSISLWIKHMKGCCPCASTK